MAAYKPKSHDFLLSPLRTFLPMPISTSEDGYLYETSLIASYAPDEDLRLNIKKYNKKKNQTTWLNKLLKAKHISNWVYNQITSKLPSWQINLSYDGKYIALAKDCYIEIKCKERSWRDDDIKMFVGIFDILDHIP